MAADLVIVANRLPVDRVELADGKPGWRALPRRPRDRRRAGDARQRRHLGRLAGRHRVRARAVRARRHPDEAGAADRGRDRGLLPRLRPRTLWPLFHDAIRTPEFHRHWWRPYIKANFRFARAAAALCGAGDMVWVHDYHLVLVPGMVRALPDARIGFFLHIPFPPADVFRLIPWRREILEGLLAPTSSVSTAQAASELRAPGRRGSCIRDAPRPSTARRPPCGRRASRSRSTRPGSGAAPSRPVDESATEIREAVGPASCCSASTGSTTPRGSPRGCAPSAC